MNAANEDDLRYTFSCPSCGGSFSIGLDKIPPVQARFSCPKCSKTMDFPSRDEARVYIQLQPGGGESSAPPPPPPPRVAPPPPPPPPISPPPPPQIVQAPPPPAPVAAAPPAPATATATTPMDPMDGTASQAGKTYRVDEKGFENDEFDRRAMRTLIRTLALDPDDMVAAGSDEAVRADMLPELKSLFELRKTSRSTPPPVCRKHIERMAYYLCNDTGRPLCEECAEEKKYGGTSVRVCLHCGGPAGDLHAAPGDMK